MEFIDKIKAKAAQNLKTIVLPEGTEERTLKAADKITQEGFAKVVLIGNPNQIHHLADEYYLKNLDNVAIVDLLPGGFEMELAAPVGTGGTGGTRADRREDRMIFFTSLGTEPSTFTYVVRAVNRGEYALPAVQAEAMYNRSIHAHAAGGSIVVE